MDKHYSIVRGVSYANSYKNLQNGSSSDISDMASVIPTIEDRTHRHYFKNFSDAPTSKQGIEMVDRDRGPIMDDTGQQKEGMSCRRGCAYGIISLMIAAVIALVVLGIYFLPEPTNPLPTNIPDQLPFCVGHLSANISSPGQSSCSRLAASVAYDVAKIRISSPGNKTVITDSLMLRNDVSVTIAGQWSIDWSRDGQLIISLNRTALTCNMQGTYLLEFLDNSNVLKYYQRLNLTYLGNLEDVRISVQPYLEGDGLSKSIVLSCEMKTGCHHGVIVPELKKGNDVTVIEDASCSYRYNASVGGEVSCTTVIDEALWVSRDEVLCRLKSDSDVHQHAKEGKILTADTDLTNFCTAVTFTIGQPGHINCRKVTQGSVNIELSRKGHYFGNWTTLLTISDHESGKALDNRLTLSATKIGNVLNINITISEVHCGDKGQLALNYTDGSGTNIDIDVNPTSDSFSQSCPASVSRALHASNLMQLICAWCPGHKVEEVIVNHTRTVSGVTTELPSFPISFYVDVRQSYTKPNLTVQFSQQYGVMQVTISRLKGVGCNYGDDYTFTLRSLEGSSTRQMSVNITVPESLYTYSFNDPPVIAGQNLEIEFKGFMGCEIGTVNAMRNGIPLPSGSVKVADEDIRDAIAFKIVWLYEPVPDSLNRQVINASISFTPPGETTLRSYAVLRRIFVLQDDICFNNANCNVEHPSEPNLFISCSATGGILAVSRCPPGLTIQFPASADCLGQCG
ncbi:LOW QUALITY PROTEIN: uncharacterized protein [Argopecten irradians]|uniref:LOW QUALITY PROTEIN: uncharacterized protein n=1 Tax=Argopecten irradians TaxID=31199 RepID=UPI00371D4169